MGTTYQDGHRDVLIGANQLTGAREARVIDRGTTVEVRGLETPCSAKMCIRGWTESPEFLHPRSIEKRPLVPIARAPLDISCPSLITRARL